MNHAIARIGCPALVLVGIAGLGGCAATSKPASPLTPEQALAGRSPRDLPMFDGRSGDRVTWDQVMDSVGGADIIIVGEQHDDAVGHAVELALTEDVLDRWPDAAVSMEMLERDEQSIVDDYLDGIIEADDLARLTFSTNWGATDSWGIWYQPLVDAARETGSPVVAANAPRRYVSLARSEGYERLDALPPARRDLVDWPAELPEGAYRDRFWEVMSEVHPSEEEAMDEEAAAAAAEAAEAFVEALFSAQLVWDTTMARSIVRAAEAGASKVVHFVGQFHCDFDGGTVQQIRAMRPEARIMVISLDSAAADTLVDDDRDRADVVVYTGGE
jgi:uncharacterized iron-regulated protein